MTPAPRETGRTALAVLVGVAVIGVAIGLLATFDPPHGSPGNDPRGDAALVLSGDVDLARLREGVRLLTTGRVSWLVVTGAGVGGDNGEFLARTAVNQGAPRDRILVETRSRTTHENIEFVAPIIRSRAWSRVVLVTSASHLGRAERVARKVLPAVTWVPDGVADAGPGSRLVRNRLNEWLKLAGYAARGWI